MEIEKRLALLQYTYAAALAEAVNTYDRMKILEDIVAKRRERQAQAATMLNQQIGVEKVEDVFLKLSEIYGCANWAVEKTGDGYEAKATSCMLCALSKKLGGASPCDGWCLDPMFAMIKAASGVERSHIEVESTLMNGEACRVLIYE